MRMLKKILASVLLSMSMAAYAADIPVDAKLDYNPVSYTHLTLPTNSLV